MFLAHKTRPDLLYFATWPDATVVSLARAAHEIKMVAHLFPANQL